MLFHNGAQDLFLAGDYLFPLVPLTDTPIDGSKSTPPDYWLK
jgi:hypothetical protein